MKQTKNQRPENMTRCLVRFTDNTLLEFAFYKDGMFQIGNYWYAPHEIKEWLSMDELNEILDSSAYDIGYNKGYEECLSEYAE